MGEQMMAKLKEHILASTKTWTAVPLRRSSSAKAGAGALMDVDAKSGIRKHESDDDAEPDRTGENGPTQIT